MTPALVVRLHVYMVAGGSPAKWAEEAVGRSLIATLDEVVAVLEGWRARGWYDSGLRPGDGWLTAAGAIAQPGEVGAGARQEPIAEKEAA